MDRKQSKFSSRRPSCSAKKRKYHGNQHSDEIGTNFSSTSANKLRRSQDDSFSVSESDSATYCFIQFALVFSSLQTIVKCQQCNSDITFSRYGQRGLGFKIKLVCQCGDRFIDSCHMINNAYEVNRRFVYVMRLIGAGLQSINYFCGYMDIGKSFNVNLYYNIIKSISESVNAVYDVVIRKAVRQEKELNVQAGFPENELSVSGDGSWSKRGFSSLLGIVSLIGKYSDKILDTIIKSSFCKACNAWNGKEDTDEYDAWYETHEPECQANHHGSAGKMEVDGIIEMFQRSIKNHNIKYAYYIGDGDTKTFKNLLEAAPYGDDFVVKKKECVLHVKKRMYRRAKEAKKQLTQLKKARKEVESQGKKVAPKKKENPKLNQKLLL